MLSISESDINNSEVDDIEEEIFGENDDDFISQDTIIIEEPKQFSFVSLSDVEEKQCGLATTPSCEERLGIKIPLIASWYSYLTDEHSAEYSISTPSWFSFLDRKIKVASDKSDLTIKTSGIRPDERLEESEYVWEPLPDSEEFREIRRIIKDKVYCFCEEMYKNTSLENKRARQSIQLFCECALAAIEDNQSLLKEMQEEPSICDFVRGIQEWLGQIFDGVVEIAENSPPHLVIQHLASSIIGFPFQIDVPEEFVREIILDITDQLIPPPWDQEGFFYNEPYKEDSKIDFEPRPLFSEQQIEEFLLFGEDQYDEPTKIAQEILEQIFRNLDFTKKTQIKKVFRKLKKRKNFQTPRAQVRLSRLEQEVLKKFSHLSDVEDESASVSIIKSQITSIVLECCYYLFFMDPKKEKIQGKICSYCPHTSNPKRPCFHCLEKRYWPQDRQPLHYVPTPTVENNVSVRFFFDRRIENLNMKNLDEETLDKIIANEFKIILSQSENYLEYTRACTINATIRELRQGLSKTFNIPLKIVRLVKDCKIITDDTILPDLGVKPFGSVIIWFVVTDPAYYNNVVREIEQVYPEPDVITVQISSSTSPKEITVEIHRRSIEKPYLGGFRHTKTGVEYFNAYTQTGPRLPKLPAYEQSHRDTQTQELREKTLNTCITRATQMHRRDLYIPNITDKILTARPYADSDSMESQLYINDKVILIQRWVRGWLARRYFAALKEDHERRLEWYREEERKIKEVREQTFRKDIIEKSFPRTKENFEGLFAMVEKWRKDEYARIDTLKTGMARRAELNLILKKEVALLSLIEHHRRAVRLESTEQKRCFLMKKIAKPIQWTGLKGRVISMDTLRTQRASELLLIYEQLKNHDRPREERVELLTSLKHALSNLPDLTIRLVFELSSLIDREIELLVRGMKNDQLEILRQRIEHLFYELFQTPEFNPESAKQWPDFFKKGFEWKLSDCVRCGKQMPSLDFRIIARGALVGSKICKSCVSLENCALARVDLSSYRRIMRIVRQDEQKRGCLTSLAFLMGSDDFRYLIETIWHSHSILCESNDLSELRLPRWDITKQWTPWNCILLTEDEARAHDDIKHLREDYQKCLHAKIRFRHILARARFAELARLDKEDRDSCIWYNIENRIDYNPPSKEADSFQ